MSSTTITIFVRLLHPYFIFLWISPHLSNKIIYTPNNVKWQIWPDVAFVDIHKEYLPLNSRMKDSFILIIGYELCSLLNPTVNVKCKTAIQVLFRYFNICKIVTRVHLPPFLFKLIVITFDKCVMFFSSFSTELFSHELSFWFSRVLTSVFCSSLSILQWIQPSTNLYLSSILLYMH